MRIILTASEQESFALYHLSLKSDKLLMEHNYPFHSRLYLSSPLYMFLLKGFQSFLVLIKREKKNPLKTPLSLQTTRSQNRKERLQKTSSEKKQFLKYIFGIRKEKGKRKKMGEKQGH